MLINTFEINIHWKEHWFIHVYSQLSTKIFLLSLWNIGGERASLVAQLVKNLPAMQETWVWFLGQEDPLEKEMAICSSTLAWKIPWMEEPGRLQSMGLQRVRHDWATSLSSILAWRIPWTEEPGGLQSIGSQESGRTERASTHEI